VTASLDELEARIEAAPEDLAGYAVLADALMAANDPRGELIALELASEAVAVDKELRAAASSHFNAFTKAFLGPFWLHARALTWRAGFIRRVTLAQSARVPDVAALLAQILAHPSGRFVTELALHVDDAAPILAALPRTLRELELVVRGPVVLPALPQVEQLAITAHEVTLDAQPYAAARRVKLACGTLTATCMEHIAEVPWPALERLELRFGTREDAPATFADVRPLLARSDLAKLTHLRLRNAPFAGGLLRQLMTAPIAHSLAVVDLSYGSMSPADAAALIANPRMLAHCKELWLPMRLLRGVDRQRLLALGPHIVDDTRAPRDNTEQLLYE
jgi:hypothetical protein